MEETTQFVKYTVKNAVELLGAFRPDVEKIQYHLCRREFFYSKFLAAGSRI